MIQCLFVSIFATESVLDNEENALDHFTDSIMSCACDLKVVAWAFLPPISSYYAVYKSYSWSIPSQMKRAG
jgi:hypothetical protein